MFSVILPTYRNPKYLDLCLKSILSGQSQKNEIIVVVDGFVDESIDIINKYNEHVNFLELDQNRGMQTSINLGVYNSKNEKILIINDDNVFCNNWDLKLKIFNVDTTVITINQIEPIGPSIFNFPIKNFGRTSSEFNFSSFLKFEESISSDSTTEDGGIFPFIVSKRNFMIVNGFDTLYQSPFICDWDFFLKLELLGCNFVRTNNCHFYHFGSVATKNRETQKEDTIKFKNSETVARETFLYKWGFPPILGKNNTHLPTEKKINGLKLNN